MWMDEIEIQATTAADGDQLVSVSGEIDTATCSELRAALLGAVRLSGSRITVDLERVEFMDVAGLTVLEEAAGLIAASGGSITLRRPSRAVCYLLDLRSRFTATEPWAIEP